MDEHFWLTPRQRDIAKEISLLLERLEVSSGDGVIAMTLLLGSGIHLMGNSTDARLEGVKRVTDALESIAKIPEPSS